jgi:bifunctional UDP-N-acetylglucosamine pyrophosphorylase/glucosamine-1-phosphate N-acetyltransferase
MNNTSFENTCAIVLAAGRGKRMNARRINKVTFSLSGEPIILRIVNNLKSAGIKDLVLVVGHAHESVEKLVGNSVMYAYQRKRLGTGHALKVGLKVVPENDTDIFVFYGDDTSYSSDVLSSLLQKHRQMSADITFLTLRLSDPKGLGRIYRDKDDNLIGIVEEKDATEEQKKILEINPGCFVFSKKFLRQYINKIHKSPATGEYYLTSLIELALENRLNVHTYTAENVLWRGINTPDELKEAEHLLTKNI